MKTIALSFVLSLLFPGLTPTAAQTCEVVNMTNGNYLCRDTVASLKQFTAMSVEGKVYLHWKVADQTSDGVYIVYRSEDGQNYEVVGQKKGVGTPHSLDIAYYFTDDFPYRGLIHYKVLHLSKELTFLAGESLSVTGSAKNMLTVVKE